MLEFAHSWLWLSLPLPLLVYLFAPPYRQSQDSVRVPFFARLVELSGQTPTAGAVMLRRLWLQRLMLLLSWLLLVCALVRPQWVGEPIEFTQSGRDLMVAVDLSGSMETDDFKNLLGEPQTRLQAVKGVLAELAGQRTHDRLGLILFADAPFLQVPFSDDHDTWLTLLNEAEIGMAGYSTHFGDAIGLAIKLFADSDRQQKVLLVLTDGNDTGSRVPPIDAARVAAARGIQIYTIAMGDPQTTGEAELDLDTLQRIATISDGAFYQAIDREQLLHAYRSIDQLEPELYETLSFRPREELFYLPVILILLLYGSLYSVLVWRGMREQSHV